MKENFAERLDAIYSIFNSKDTALYDYAVSELRNLVKEAYDNKLFLLNKLEKLMVIQFSDSRWAE